MNSMWKRSFALLLSLVMVFGMVPVNTFAEETECSHSYKATVTDPTCTAVGYTTYTCACGDTYTADEVAATGHSYADGFCSVCGAEEHTHSYEAVVTAPTCGEAGFTTYTCACGDTYTADEVAATGHSYADGFCSVCGAAEHTHSYESVVTAPTCTEAGFTTYTCSCGDSYTADEVAALGHSYADGVCGTCGAVEVKVCSVDENCEADTHEAECPMGPCTVTVGCELVKGHEARGIPCTGSSILDVDKAIVALNKALVEGNGVYDGNNATITLKDSERSYQNNQTAQFFLAQNSWDFEAEAPATISISNVTFVFEDDDTSNTYTSGELQVFANNITFTNCKFIGVAVSPWGKDNTTLPETAVFTGCVWQNLSGRYGVHQNRAKNLTVTGCSFENCQRGIHTNSSAPETITITNNTFTGIDDKYGVLCLAENGNIGNTELSISNNTAEGQVFLRQLNQNATTEQLNEILNPASNTYGSEFVVGSSVPFVAKIENTFYGTVEAAMEDAEDGAIISLLADVTENVTINKPITLNGNGKKLTGDVVVKANTTFKGDFAVSGNVKAGYGDHSVSNMEVIVDGNLSAGYFYLGNKSEHYPNGGEHKLTINSGAVLDAGTLHVRTTGVMTAVNATVKAGDLYVRGTMTVDGCTMSHQSTVSGGTGHWTIYEDDDATKTASLTLNNSTASSNYLVVGSGSNSENDANSNAVLSMNGGSLQLNNLYIQGKADVFTNNAATFTNAEVNVKNAFVHAKALMNVSGSTVAAETIKNAGTINVSGNSKLTAPNVTGGTVNVAAGTVLTDTTLGGAANTSFKTGVITFNGENKITTNIDNSVSNFDFVVNKGATLLIPRYTLGYGRDITVNGNIVDASAFKPGDATPSLKANSSSGFSIGGTGVNTLTAKDAYLDFGSSSWKTAQGKYDWTFENSYVKAVSFGNMNPAGSADAAWTVTFDGSVLAAGNYIKAPAGVTYSFTNDSDAETGSMCIGGVLNIDATSSVTVTANQNNEVGKADEHGDILGTVNVEGVLCYEDAGSNSIDLLGGKINVLAGGEMAMSNKILYTDDDAVLTVAVGGTLSTAAIEGDCKIFIDAKNYKYGDASPVIGKVSTNNIEVINNEYVTASKDEEGNIVLTGPTVYTKDKDGKTIGGYTNLEKAITAASTNTAIKIIEVQADINQASAENSGYHDIPGDLTICSAEGGNYKVSAPIDIRVMGNGAKLTIAENVTIENLQIVANGFGTTNESMVINGALKALTLKQWTNNNSIIVNPTGTVELGYGDGQFDMANGNVAVTVTGNRNKTVAQFKAGYSVARGNGNTLNLKDTYFEAGAWFNIEGKNSTFNADNALLKVSGGDFAGSLNVTGTGNVFNLTNGSEMNSGSIALGAGNTINVSADSNIKATTISGAGKLVIDATGMTAGVYQNVKGNVANFTGTIEVVNNNTVVAKIVADEGGATKHIELVDVVAVVDGKGYATLEEAVAVADGKTITLMKDVLDGNTFTTPVKIDLNENTLVADFYGTLTMNGGTYRNANGFRMVAPETANDASAYAYNSSDAVLKISAEGIDITKGTMSIGLPDGMGTDPNHKLQLLNDAKLVIPQGKPLVLRSEAKVASTATVEGTILLEGNGTIITAKELSVASATNGYKVIYHGGKYQLVMNDVVAVVDGQYYNLNTALNNVEDNGTVTLIEDVAFDQITIAKPMTLNLNGKKLVGKVVVSQGKTVKIDTVNKNNVPYGIVLDGGDSVTGSDDGKLTVTAAKDTNSNYGSFLITKPDGANKTIARKVFLEQNATFVAGSTTSFDVTKADFRGEYLLDKDGNGIISKTDIYSEFLDAAGNPMYAPSILKGEKVTIKVRNSAFLDTCTQIYVNNERVYNKQANIPTVNTSVKVYVGCTELELTADYVKNLPAGTHSVKFYHTIDGTDYITESKFTVYTVYNANADTTNPKTGDEIFVPMFVMFSTAAALAVLVMGKKKHF